MNAPCLFDVNILVALMWNVHSLNAKAHHWFARENPQVLGCVFTELSFLRISMADKTIAVTFAEAHLALAGFITHLGPRYHFLDRLPPVKMLAGAAVANHKQLSDFYLCELAAKHGARLATLDAGIKHPAALLVA